MKVLMLGWEFPPIISGGLGTACYGLTKDLAKLGVDITFVLPKTVEKHSDLPIKVIGPSKAVLKVTQEEFDSDGDEILKKYKVDCALHPYMSKQTYAEYLRVLKKKQEEDPNFKPVDYDPLELTGGYGENLMIEVSRYAAIGKFLAQSEEFDVIHAHDWMTYQAGIEAKRASGKPLIVHVHATEYDRTADNINSEIYAIEKYGMDMSDIIIAVSERTKDTIVHQYSQDPKKIKVVYNAVEKDDMFEIKSIVEQSKFNNDKIVVFLGRITAQKGPEYFIDAANLVIKKLKNVRFVMAGNGDMTPEMVERMAKYRLTERFHFTGFLDPALRERLFAMSDLYVMPSVSEPFGITPLEAIKHDIPVIISKQSGIAEILDHVVKVDFWDVHKLAQSITDILTQPDLSRSMVEKNKEVLSKIDWENAAKDVFCLYKHCCGVL